MTATALPLMSVLDFCLFTTIWDDPKEFEAGRFAADILYVVIVGMSSMVIVSRSASCRTLLNGFGDQIDQLFKSSYLQN